MADPIESETPRETYLWRGMLRHVPKSPPSYVPRRNRLPRDAADAGFLWLLPWKKKEYPGQGKGWAEALGHKATVRSVRAWRDGFRTLPSWAAEALASEIESRAKRGLELAREIREEAAKPRRRAPAGFAVPGADGLDKRPKSGRRPAKGDREL